VIIVRLLVRSAPGVSAICSRLTTLDVVEDSGFTPGAVSAIWMVSLWVARLNPKCSLASRPEVSVNFCSCRVKPGISTVTMYAPRGTASKRNSPASSLMTVLLQSESADRRVTWAPATGRCCGS